MNQFADAVPYTPEGFLAAGIDPPPSSAALWRWRVKGICGQRPTTHLRGGRRFIYRSDIAGFFSAVTRAKDGTAPRPLTASANAQRADNELSKEGM